MRRRLVLVVALLGAGAHLAYWYPPRVHSMSPAKARLVGPAIAEDGDHRALWIPYPHQNLGVLPELEPVLSGLQAAIGSRVVQLPRLGPFVVPPASELLLVDDDRTLRVELRFFPFTAVVARLAGWLAGNPWLTGGGVEVAGDRFEVGWSGSTWSARTGPATIRDDRGDAPDEQTLGVIRFPGLLASERTAALLVSHQPGRLWLHLAGDQLAPELTEVVDVEGRGVALAVFAAGRPVEGFLVFDRPSGATGIPQLAALGEPEAARRALPIAGALGRQLPRRPYPGGEVVGLDSGSLASVIDLEPFWRGWVGSAPGAPSVLLWLEPDAAAAAAARFGDSDWRWLASRHQRQRWRGVREALAALHCWRGIVARASADGRQAVVAGERRSSCAR